MRDKHRLDQPDVNKGGGMAADSGATAAAAAARTILTAGSSYTGYVETVNPDGTYHVTIPSVAVTVEDVQDATSMFLGVIGYRVNALMVSGVEVVVVYGPPSFIVGVIPNQVPDDINGDNRRMVHGDKTNPASIAGQEGGRSMAEDLLEGEYELTNLMGTAMSFLTTMIQMKAGDRARVECLLQQGMVRVISEQFKHFSAMGEEHLYDDGRLSGETNHTSYPHEALGMLDPNLPLDSGEIDELNLDDVDRVDDIGRWRYTQLKGYIAGFIHQFVTDPVKTVGKMSEESLRPGKSWIHKNNDGSLIIQSTAEVAIERVVRIPVPVRRKIHEDPEILKKRKFDELNTDLLKVWDYGKKDGTEVYRTAYQLREYSRWLSRLHSFSRMLQMSDEFKVPAESEGEDPEWHNDEKDIQDANSGGVTYLESYACIRIMRDGSIVNHDGYGSTISMSNGNLQLSASRHLDLQAAGDIRISAGQSLFIKARRHVEINATLGSLIMKGKTALKALCELGSIFIKSDAQNPDSPDFKEPDVEDGDPKPEILKQAVFIDVPDGQFAVNARYRAEIVTTGESFSDFSGEADHVENTSAAVVLDSRSSNVKTRAAQHLMQVSSGTIGVRTNLWVWKSPVVYGDVQELDINQKFTVTAAGLTTQIINTEFLQAQKSIVGPERGPTPLDPPVPGVRPHYGHVGIIDEDFELVYGENEDAINKRNEISSSSTQFVDIWEGRLPTFSFLDASDYYWDASEETRGALVETLTQQHLRVDSPQYWKDVEYDGWNWSSDLVTGIRIDSVKNKPFGTGGRHYTHTGGEDLHKASSTSPISFANKASSWRLGPINFQYLKRP